MSQWCGKIANIDGQISVDQLDGLTHQHSIGQSFNPPAGLLHELLRP
jgi:hypothetical protein